MITMYDTVTISTVPNNPQAVAGYVGGSWPDFSALVAKFPNAKHKSIAVNASEDADILDIENGDAVPSEAPAWVRRQQARGLKIPGLYANASTMPSVVAILTAAGISRNTYHLWLAHYTFVQPTPPFEQGADAVQYTDAALGRNLDASYCQDAFFVDAPTPPKPIYNPPHYAWFAPGGPNSKWGKLNEQKVVTQYDGARKRPLVYALYLKFVLRPKLQVLANYVADAAIHQDPQSNGKPSWSKNHRGWRFQQLVHRAQGVRFV